MVSTVSVTLVVVIFTIFGVGVYMLVQRKRVATDFMQNIELAPLPPAEPPPIVEDTDSFADYAVSEEPIYAEISEGPRRVDLEVEDIYSDAYDIFSRPPSGFVIPTIGR